MLVSILIFGLLSGCKSPNSEITPVQLPTQTESSIPLVISNPFDYPPLEQSILKEGEVFLLGTPFSDFFHVYGSTFYEKLYIVSGKGELLHQMNNVTLPENTSQIIDTEQKLFLGVYQAGEMVYGLYDFKAMNWHIEPLYKDVNYSGDGYFSAVKEGKIGILNRKGEVIVPFELDEDAYNFYRSSQSSQYFTFYSYNVEAYKVYDIKGQLIIKDSPHQISGFGSYLVHHDYTKNNSSFLTNTAGEVLLESSDFYNITLLGGFDREEYLVYKDMENYTVYDLELKPLLKLPIGNINYVEMYKNWYSTSDFEGNMQFFWLDGPLAGQEISSQTGDVYTRIVYNSRYTTCYIGRDYTDGFEILDLNSNKTYSFPVEGDLIYYFEVFEDGSYFYAVDDPNGFHLYMYQEDGTPLFDEIYNNIFAYDNWVILQAGSQYQDNQLQAHNTLIDKEGKILYQSEFNERISPVNDDYLFLQRGNYLGIADLEGQWIFKVGPSDY